MADNCNTNPVLQSGIEFQKASPMHRSIISLFQCVLVVFLIYGCRQHPQQGEEKATVSIPADPLPSWQEGATKQTIIDFISRTTQEGGPDFVPIADRIACFDNDGTLWMEQPIYFQVAFAMDQVKAMAAEHPEWKGKQPFKSLLEGDMKSFMAGGEQSLAAVMSVTHGGMTTDEFSSNVRNWMKTARHPKSGKKYNEMVYQPMLELLSYLRSNGYKTFIVSGGGVDFMRAWTEEAYQIPPYQVVGTLGEYQYQMREGNSILIKQAEMNFNDDKAGKPVGIQRSIGKTPVFSAGNSDGDFEMLQFTSTADGPRLGMIIHHTDSTREYAYDRLSHIGRLNKGLDSAAKYNWLIVDMKRDWKKVFSFDP
jgi:phosphoglycolate phosphatase-like HAD superfamily hydrolase